MRQLILLLVFTVSLSGFSSEDTEYQKLGSYENGKIKADILEYFIDENNWKIRASYYYENGDIKASYINICQNGVHNIIRFVRYRNGQVAYVDTKGASPNKKVVLKSYTVNGLEIPFSTYSLDSELEWISTVVQFKSKYFKLTQKPSPK